MRFYADLANANEGSRLRRTVVNAVVARAVDSVDATALEFIMGELVANAVEHAPGPVTVQINWQSRPPRLTFEDKGNGFDITTVGLSLPDSGDDGGRGLYIINELGGHLRVDCSGKRRCRVSVDLPVGEQRHSVCREIPGNTPGQSFSKS